MSSLFWTPLISPPGLENHVYNASISIQKYQCDPKRDCAENQGTWVFMSPQRLGSATSFHNPLSAHSFKAGTPVYSQLQDKIWVAPNPGWNKMRKHLKIRHEMIWKETLQIPNQWSYCLTRSKQSPAAPTLWIKPWEWSSATALVAMSLFHRGKAVSDPLGNVQQWPSLAKYIQLPYVHQVKYNNHAKSRKHSNNKNMQL